MAEWAVGGTGDATGGNLTLSPHIQRPNWVVWPSHIGSGNNESGANASVIRGYTTYPSLASGTFRNLELGMFQRSRNVTSASTINVDNITIQEWPWWLLINPTDVDSLFLDIQRPNTDLIVFTCSVLAFLYDPRCLELGGPRNWKAF